MRRFRTDEEGVVLIATTILAPLLLILLALTVEMGMAYSMRAEQQRAADLAAYSGALRAAKGGTVEAALADAAAIAALNSPNASQHSVVEANYNGQGAVRARIEREYPLQIARLAGLGETLDIGAQATAITLFESAACVMALNPEGAGVHLTGGTRITAVDCEVSSGAGVNVPCGTYITAETVTWFGTEPHIGCEGIRDGEGNIPPIRQAAPADPMAGHEGIASLAELREAAAELTAPELQFAPEFTFDYSPKEFPVEGCTATKPSPYAGSWTVSCLPRAEPYDFGRLTISGGIQLEFATDGDPGNTYRIGSINALGGSQVAFGPGNFEIADGLSVAGGARTTFAAGNFRIGSITVDDVFNIGGSSYLGFASAGTFEVTGNIRSQGGGCLMLPDADTHLVRGSVYTSGGLRLGSGTWVIDGVVSLASGGDVQCDGRPVALEALRTTIVVNGNGTGEGACAGFSFCLGAGFRGAKISAPVGGDLAGLAVIGPTEDEQGARLHAGAYGTVVGGLFYFPTQEVDISGGADLGAGAECLQIIGGELVLTGSGNITASACEDAIIGNERTRLVQ